MVLIKTDNPNKSREVDRLYLEYSPLLNTWMKEPWMIDNTIVINDFDPYLIFNYLDFLEGKPFDMDEDIEEFFDYMGHGNSFRYPYDYWKLKLRNRWIRDNFYKYNLCDKDNGLYGLEEVPVSREIHRIGDIPYLDMDRSITIAGGAALYLSGFSDYFADIDLFPMNKEKGIEFVKASDLDIYDISVATVSGHAMCYYTDNVTGVNIDVPKDVQLIKRVFSCPAEIVHGFDIDCTGFVLVKDSNNTPRLYATEIALYSAERKTMWFDAEFTENRYYWRLGKYIGKQFDLKLPMINEYNFNTGYIWKIIHGLSTNRNVPTVGIETESAQLRRFFRGDAFSHIPSNLGTLLLLMRFLDIRPSTSTSIATSADLYFESVLGLLKIPGIKFENYGAERDEPHESTINDWVVRDKIVLREPYISDLHIPDAETLMEIYRSSPLYKDNE